jgi:NADH-quinone oxidoreductase subunit J
VIPVLAQAATEAAGGAAGEFWVFVVVGAVSLGSAIAMVLLRNAVHAALMLVLNFFTIAIFYAMLEAQFLAVTQIIVYAGAIMVLFLFVIMLLGIASAEERSEKVGAQKVAAVLLGVVLFGGVATSVAAPYLGSASVCGAGETAAEGDGIACRGLAEANADGNVQGIGRLMFTDYVWPFEVTSVLLVIAAIGVIVVGRKSERPEDLTDGATPVDEAARRQAGESPLDRRSPTRTRSPGERT